MYDTPRLSRILVMGVSPLLLAMTLYLFSDKIPFVPLETQETQEIQETTVIESTIESTPVIHEREFYDSGIQVEREFNPMGIVFIVLASGGIVGSGFAAYYVMKKKQSKCGKTDEEINEDESVATKDE